MLYEHIKEPLGDPANTLEVLLNELLCQAFKAAKPMGDTPGDILGDLEKKAAEIAECAKAHKAIKTEILRRFAELDGKIATAEQATRIARLANGFQ